MANAADRPPLWERYYPAPRVLSHVICYPCVTSTMDVAWQSTAHGDVVMALEQGAGRGRFGRQWITTPGAALALSARLDTNAVAARLLSMRAGVGVARAIGSIAGVDARLKWPNDVLIDGSKAGGILVESRVDTLGNVQAVLGIGLNVNAAPSIPVLPSAISLHDAANASFDLVRVLDGVMAHLDAALVVDTAPLLATYREMLATTGRVTVATHGGKVSGDVLGISDIGALLLRDDAGATQELSDGEVTMEDVGPWPQANA